MVCMRQRAVGLIVAVGLVFACVGDASAQVSNGSFEQNSGSFAGWGTAGDNQIETSSLGSGPTDGTHDALLATMTDGSVNSSVVAGSGVSAASLESLLQVSSGTLNSVGNGTPVIGSAISQTITVASGSILTFDWDFMTNQVYNDGVVNDSYAPLASNDDFGFFTIAQSGNPNSRVITKLADTFYGYVNNPNLPGGFGTGFTITAASNPFVSETGFQTFSLTINQAGTYVIGAGSLHVTTGADDGINSALLVDHFGVAAVPEPASSLAFGTLCMGLAIRRRRAKSA